MSIWIEKDEATAARRRVPCRLFTSNGTAPDTGATADAVIMGVGSAVTISLSSTLRPMNTAQGMYWIELAQSEVSVLGTHPLYHTAGDFPQHFANVQVVNSNPFSNISAAGTGFWTSLLSYNMGDTRYFQDMFMAVRNRVDASSSVGTVYKTDDSTSAWTFSISTAANGIVAVNPAS